MKILVFASLCISSITDIWFIKVHANSWKWSVSEDIFITLSDQFILSLCSDYFKNICGLCNGKHWPPFALLAKLPTLHTATQFVALSLRSTDESLICKFGEWPKDTNSQRFLFTWIMDTFRLERKPTIGSEQAHKLGSVMKENCQGNCKMAANYISPECL